MSDNAISIRGLSKGYVIGEVQHRYRTLRDSLAMSAEKLFRRRRPSAGGPRTLWALHDLTFDIKRGEVMGIIGRNGAGKSTLLKILSRITEPTAGFAEIRGRIGSLLEVGTGFHPELTGRENIFLNGAILGMPRAEIKRRFDEIVAFSEVEQFIDTPVKHYSSGMYMRLAFSVAAHLEPDILLIDEVLAVGDVSFQRKCLGKMDEVARQGRTVLFVSHNLGTVRALCNTGLVLHNGGVVQCGSISGSIEAYYKVVAESENLQSVEHRSGFGPVTLTTHESATIDQSDAFEVATTLTMQPDITGFTLFCLVADVHQRPILHLRESSSNLVSGRISNDVYRIQVRIPALWLEPGLYVCYFKAEFWGQMFSADKKGYVSDTFHLDVAGDSSGIDTILNPQVVWSLACLDAMSAR